MTGSVQNPTVARKFHPPIIIERGKLTDVICPFCPQCPRMHRIQRTTGKRVHPFFDGISEQLAGYAGDIDKHLKERTVVVVTRKNLWGKIKWAWQEEADDDDGLLMALTNILLTSDTWVNVRLQFSTNGLSITEKKLNDQNANWGSFDKTWAHGVLGAVATVVLRYRELVDPKYQHWPRVTPWPPTHKSILHTLFNATPTEANICSLLRGFAQLSMSAVLSKALGLPYGSFVTMDAFNPRALWSQGALLGTLTVLPQEARKTCIVPFELTDQRDTDRTGGQRVLSVCAIKNLSLCMGGVINQRHRTCWLVSVFTLFLRVHDLFGLINENLQQQVLCSASLGSEGDCMLGPSKHHQGTAICPRLPDEFLAFCGNALDYTNGYNPFRFFWEMLLYKSCVSVWFTVTDGGDMVSMGGVDEIMHEINGYFGNSSDKSASGFAWEIVKMQWQRQSKAEDLLDHLLDRCKRFGAIGGLLVTTPVTGVGGHSIAFTVCHGVLILCTWGQCGIIKKMEDIWNVGTLERFRGGDTFALLLRPQRWLQTFASVGTLDF